MCEQAIAERLKEAEDKLRQEAAKPQQAAVMTSPGVPEAQGRLDGAKKLAEAPRKLCMCSARSCRLIMTRQAQQHEMWKAKLEAIMAEVAKLSPAICYLL